MMSKTIWESFEQIATIDDLLQLVDKYEKEGVDLALDGEGYAKFMASVVLDKCESVKDLEKFVVNSDPFEFPNKLSYEEGNILVSRIMSQVGKAGQELLRHFMHRHALEYLKQLDRSDIHWFLSTGDTGQLIALKSLEDSEQDFLKLASQSPKRMLLEALAPLDTSTLKRRLTLILLKHYPELLEFVTPPEFAIEGVSQFVTGHLMDYCFLCKEVIENKLEALRYVKIYDVPLAIQLFLNKSHLQIEKLEKPLLANGKVTHCDILQFMDEVTTSPRAFSRCLDYSDRLVMWRQMPEVVKKLHSEDPSLIFSCPEGKRELLPIALAANGKLLEYIYPEWLPLDTNDYGEEIEREVLRYCETLEEYENFVKIALDASGLEVLRFIQRVTVPIAEAIVAIAHKKG